jgi:hypothetical protein
MKSGLGYTVFLLVSMYGAIFTGGLKAQTENHHFLIKTSPVRMIDPVNPGFELGLEVVYSPKFSTHVSGTAMTNLVGAGIYEEYSGYRLALEQKWYFFRREYFRLFTALEFAYMNSTFQHTDEFRIPLDDLYTYHYEYPYEHFTETYAIHKEIFNISPRYGIQAIFGRLVLEGGVGIGIKYREVRHVDRITSLDYLHNPNANPVFPGLRPLGSKENTRWTLAIPVHLKIGIAL